MLLAAVPQHLCPDRIQTQPRPHGWLATSVRVCYSCILTSSCIMMSCLVISGLGSGLLKNDERFAFSASPFSCMWLHVSGRPSRLSVSRQLSVPAEPARFSHLWGDSIATRHQQIISPTQILLAVVPQHLCPDRFQAQPRPHGCLATSARVCYSCISTSACVMIWGAVMNLRQWGSDLSSKAPVAQH